MTEVNDEETITGNVEFAREVRSLLKWHIPGKRIAYRVAGRMTKVSHTVINDMAMGGVPRMETVIQFGRGMKGDTNKLLRLAGYPEIVSESKAEYMTVSGPPKWPEDWPETLKQAIAFTRELPPEVQEHIYNLWLEQAGPHAQIYRQRRAVELEIIELEKKKERLDDENL